MGILEELFTAGGELGIPVGFLVSPHNYDEIEALQMSFQIHQL
ncbi:MAG: hypothetical protein CM1200mP39_05290 [Dehalococcoidia bacterium]|nr:MAG: hypothetical protein CM1200mP39_05290 [Dehalococcoidia bacterium]